MALYLPKLNDKADVGNWILDLSQQKRSLGFVQEIHTQTEGMLVYWPKTGKSCWVVWNNYGHYTVI